MIFFLKIVILGHIWIYISSKRSLLSVFYHYFDDKTPDCNGKFDKTPDYNGKFEKK